MEKVTTVRLEINGEPAKNTLDALRQRAEVLSQKISAIKIHAQVQGTGNEGQNPNISEQSAELQRLEREYAAVSYAKYNRIDLEDEQAVPYEMIVVQPFTATSDPTVLGIMPIPNINDKIKAMLNKYRAETIDIEDITYEEADLEESTLFPTVERLDTQIEDDAK